MTILQEIKNEKIILKLILITLPRHKNSLKASSTLTKSKQKRHDAVLTVTVRHALK